MKIAILGGTGDQGPGLALRLAMAGEEVIIGSRDPQRAEKMAAELNAELGGAFAAWITIKLQVLPTLLY